MVFRILTIRKNYKTFTLFDVFRMAEFYYSKKLIKIASKLISIFPKKTLSKYRTMYFGEMFVVAKKID